MFVSVALVTSSGPADCSSAYTPIFHQLISRAAFQPRAFLPFLATLLFQSGSAVLMLFGLLGLVSLFEALCVCLTSSLPATQPSTTAFFLYISFLHSAMLLQPPPCLQLHLPPHPHSITDFLRPISSFPLQKLQ